ncbi:hypothetical protein [Streptomyces sp. NPDC004528]|uniref:hypothetical protein n=1 Tax=Streptomyces sp. NPDC004528 TaxID=3154550 RepID=UPI0033B3DBC1
MASEISDPITELAAAAVQQHELYQAWIDAGFTRAEALELLKAVLLGSAAGGGE